MLFVNFFVQQLLLKSNLFQSNSTRATIAPVYLHSLKMLNVRIMKGLMLSVSILFPTRYQTLLSAFPRRVLSWFCHICWCLLECVGVKTLAIAFSPQTSQNRAWSRILFVQKNFIFGMIKL